MSEWIKTTPRIMGACVVVDVLISCDTISPPQTAQAVSEVFLCLIYLDHIDKSHADVCKTRYIISNVFVMNYSSLHITTNFHVIKKWVEERGGMPARIHSDSEETTSLKIFYPMTDNVVLDIIPWSEFFDEFALLNLAFMYQSDVRPDETSMFYKFVRREDYIDELVEEEEEEDNAVSHELEFLHM